MAFLKKAFFLFGMVTLIFVSLFSLLLAIMGSIDKITSMAVCGAVLFALTIVAMVCLEKKDPFKEVRRQNREKQKAQAAQHREARNAAKGNKVCCICGCSLGETWKHSPVGEMCVDCWGLLNLKGVSTAKMKLYGIDLLRLILKKELILREDCTPGEKLEKLIVTEPSISLIDNETCYYEGDAVAYREKNIVTGRTGGNAGVNIRVAKGVSVYTGGGESQTIRENVRDCVSGTMYITNFRFVLLAPKYGFEIFVPKLAKIEFQSGGFRIYSGSKCFCVLTNDAGVIKKLVALMNECQAFKDEKVINKKRIDQSDKREIDNLREYKKLLDEGIITQEEFETKKKQLLDV